MLKLIHQAGSGAQWTQPIIAEQCMAGQRRTSQHYCPVCEMRWWPAEGSRAEMWSALTFQQTHPKSQAVTPKGHSAQQDCECNICVITWWWHFLFLYINWCFLKREGEGLCQNLLTINTCGFFLLQNQHIAGDKPLLVGCCIGVHSDNATPQATKDDRE